MTRDTKVPTIVPVIGQIPIGSRMQRENSNLSFGDEIRRARELREISLREISEATKISLRHLEAMERNDFAHLPGGAYNRGYIRAYCEHIGLDAESMVNAYLLEERTQHDREPQAENGLLRGNGRKFGAGVVDEKPAAAATASTPRRWIVWAGIVLAVAASICYFIFFVPRG